MLTPLAAAIVSALYPASPAMAQENPDDGLEQVVDTGSRIRKDTYTSATPMNVVLAETAIAKGVPDLATMLQTATVAAGSSPRMTTWLTGGEVDTTGAGVAFYSRCDRLERRYFLNVTMDF